MNPLNLAILLGITSVCLLLIYNFRISEVKENISQKSPSPTASLVTYKAISNSSELVYPGATDSNSDGATFESFDDVSLITDWYKDKIQSLNMSTTSFIQTNTNGNILNRMIGSDGKKEIEIEISKRRDQEEVQIILNVNN